MKAGSEEGHGFGRAFLFVGGITTSHVGAGALTCPAGQKPGKFLRRLYSRLIRAATYPAPNPLSIFTTLTFEAQEFIIPKSAASPLNAAP